MILTEVKYRKYRSIKNDLTIHLDNKITVIIGANDHGKSNLIEGLLFLNHDKSLDFEDMNWDCDSNESDCLIEYVFELSDEEKSKLKNIIYLDKKKSFIENRVDEDEELNQERSTIHDLTNTLNTRINEHTKASKAHNEIALQLKSKPSDESLKSQKEQALADQVKASKSRIAAQDALDQARSTYEAKINAIVESDFDIKLDEIIPPDVIQCERNASDENELEWYIPDDTPTDEFIDFIDEHVPRVEQIVSYQGVSDTATEDDLTDGSNEFMKGIFYYAGLSREDWPTIFEQNHRSTRKLEKANAILNNELKKTWTQGSDLTFKLQHDSKNQAINLMVEDPAVAERYVRASRRSSGFTHYFTLKSILYAKQKEHPAKSYIWLFDEPGIYLHPSGQHDLLHELESLGQSNQIIYSTHSLFMINKNFPPRHRLVTKDHDGTRITEKPYTGRWKKVIGALGLNFAGTFLFANYIVITEGDSDAILLGACMQKLVENKIVDIDLNSLSFIGCSTSRDAKSLITMLKESYPSPQIAVLVDGDKGGKDRLTNLKSITSQYSIPTHALGPENTSTEDHIICPGHLYTKALTNLLTKLYEDGIAKLNPDKLELDIKQSYEQEFSTDLSKVTTGISKWSQDFVKNNCEVDSLSKNSLAREYAELIADFDLNDQAKNAYSRLLKLVEWLQSDLGVPAVNETKQSTIFNA